MKYQSLSLSCAADQCLLRPLLHVNVELLLKTITETDGAPSQRLNHMIN